GEQLVLWPLLAEGLPASELALEDLEPAAALLAAARAWSEEPDAKAQTLREILADGKTSLVFTTTIATVRYLRRHLGRGAAWCTGRAAGLDEATAEREDVLDWFRKAVLPGDGVLPRPRLLLATDVASEGLDLPLLQRVIHYDLPWTAVRLEQRSGRALRLGSLHRHIEVIRLLPPPSLEATLRQHAILQLKAGLPQQLGLGRAEDAPWRLRARIAASWRAVEWSEGVGVTRGPGAGAAAGFRLGMSDGSLREVVLARSATGWSDDPATIAGLLEAAQGARTATAPPARALRPVSRALAVLVREALRQAHGARLLRAAGSAPSRRALRRILALAREAARKRETGRLALLERGLCLLRRGHTAGEARLVEQWAELPLAELLARLGRLPAEPAPPEVRGIELIGLLLVEPPGEAC
ncbi:MAG TPA: helicase-related protein, partial [Gemmatimonadales bacterium]|nr:helicase-related protein [Gemmatimonadales bacterium]